MSKPEIQSGDHATGPGLTPRQQREIAALEAMPDSEIDTSDIPEQGPEFFKNAKVGVFYRPPR